MTIKHSEHLDTLRDIRSMMERSSRFISLSGLSGVAAGISALAGAAAAYWYFGTLPFSGPRPYYLDANHIDKLGLDYVSFCLLVAALVVVFAIGFGIFFTTRKAKRKGQPIWDALTRRLLLSLAIPLAAGGIFCIGLLELGLFGLVAPATLLFYGLGLVNASKYTLPDIWFLGISEIILGLIGVFFIGYGLELWAIGFGILHIVYGMYMHFKYDHAKAQSR